ncbi:MAG TPA: nuclear transport factor 2 family protein [Terracidiphilus sp.]|nr:nuclear transport factor 2 family protein [Terracidiphilus sp.]
MTEIARFLSSAMLALLQCAVVFAQKPRPQAHPVSIEGQVIAAETVFQKDESTANLTALKGLLLPDFVEADREIMNRDQLLNLIQRAHSIPCQFGDATVEHPIVTFLDPDIATIAYHSKQNLTCGGHVLVAEANISSVWVNTAGHWKARLHAEIVTAANVK